MSAAPLPIRNLAIEWRFPPSLRTYGAMDQIGLHFGDRFPDWERSPLTLEVRNKKRRHRLFFSFRRCFFDRIGATDADLNGEIELALEVFDRFGQAVTVEKIDRVGLRSWSAFERPEPFKELVARFEKKFHPADGKLVHCLLGTVSDSGYMADVETADGWKYRLWAGPMERAQWFELVPHEINLFESRDDFLKYRTDIPERMLFIDIDCHKSDMRPGDIRLWVNSAMAKTREVLEGVYRHFSGE
jgi:hypothetical protein